jgi:hypothetical protein
MGWRAQANYEAEERARWRALPWRERHNWRDLFWGVVAVFLIVVTASSMGILR